MKSAVLHEATFEKLKEQEEVETEVRLLQQELAKGVAYLMHGKAVDSRPLNMRTKQCRESAMPRLHTYTSYWFWPYEVKGYCTCIRV